MPLDLDILAESGLTRERLRQFFTAKPVSPEKELELSEDEKERIDRDVEKRKEFEDDILDKMQEHIVFCLNNYQLFSAVDLAWDSVPINKNIMPLIMYAQGRIRITEAVNSLRDVPNGDRYLKKNDKGQIVGIDLPKFFEVNVNLIRSVISRRVAAQANKYNQLWPYFKYESRYATDSGRFLADAISQRVDVMADQYDYRHFQTQVIRDMFLYGHAVVFPRASWERDVHWRKQRLASEFESDVDANGEKRIRKESYTVREGLSFVNPHPSRVFYDNSYPMSSINTDNGCQYIGFWDVCRWGDIANNHEFFNRDSVEFSSDTAAWFTTYSIYFNQYMDKISPPQLPENQAQSNDRKSNVGVYTGEDYNSSVFFTDLFVKVIPNQWGLGTYPFPVWLHLKVAGDATVVYADIMPSTPAAVFSYNENDGRLSNISMAHELMPYQDQLTNLLSQLLETTKTDLFAVAMLNRDAFPNDKDGLEARERFRRTMSGTNFYSTTSMLEVSFEGLRANGIDVNPDNVFKIVRSAPNTGITELFQAITQLIMMSDKLMVMSPQELGQPAPREISATESTMIGGATEAVYNFIGDAIDEGRSAMKRMIYESLIACGSNEMIVPVSTRYPVDVVEEAGFQFIDPQETVVKGPKRALIHDYIFTSRDGGGRIQNVQSAQVLVQFLQGLTGMGPEMSGVILNAMGKQKLFDIINEIMRLTSTVDLKLESKPGEDDSFNFGPSPQEVQAQADQSQQAAAAIQQVGQQVQQNTQAIGQILQMLGVAQNTNPAVGATAAPMA